MSPRRNDDRRDPKESLLEAAQAVFAAEGFRGATVSKISQAAEANIAAVNYHFGNKENLFIEVIRRSFDMADAVYPVRGDSATGRSVAARLEAFISAFIRRTLDPEAAGDFNRIMSKTVGDDSAPWLRLVEEIERLELGVLREILGDFFGSADVDPKRVDRAMMQVMGQCTMVVKMPGPMGEVCFAAEEGTIQAYIEDATRYALGGLRALKREGRS